MFFKILKDNFCENEPIFISEILSVFKFYSHSNIYRYLDMLVKNKKLMKFSMGIYYLPDKNMNVISEIDVIKKRFITNNQEVYGIFTGSNLLNSFLTTKQIKNDIEIITNYEPSRARKMNIKNINFVIKKSRIKITKDNYKIYTLLEFFSILKKEDEKNIDLKRLNNFIKDNNIKKEKLFELLYKFPSKVAKQILVLEIMK